MKLKRILTVFLIILFILAIKTFAVSTGDIITYNGITTEMPEIVLQDDTNIEEDPIYKELASTPALMSANINDNSISSLINTYETSGDAAVGIDVSRWQGNIDWTQVANSGVKFAMIRCGYRGTESGTIYEDSTFKTNIQGALNNGIYVGIYFYSAAINEEEAIQEAAVVAQLINGYDIKYPIAYDFELFSADGSRTDGMSKEQINANGKAFLRYIESKGYNGMLYGSSNPLNNIWDNEICSAYDIWVAHYGVSKPSYTGHYDIWQCTSSGSVPGISGNVDMDIDYSYYMNYNRIDITNYLFDSTYYADRYSDLKAAFGYNESALRNHWLNNGIREGRSASPVFDPVYYVNSYSDLKVAFGNNYVLAYNHFISNGIHEGRKSSKYFDITYYLKNNSDVKKAYYSSKSYALTHFVNNGIREGRQGSSEFNIKTYYNSQNSYTKKHLGTTYLKYYSLADGGKPINDSPINITNYLFDATYYANKYSDLKKAFGYNANALKQHYEQFGIREGRSASPVFDPVYYVNSYSDLKVAFGTDYVLAYNHFISNGIHEGRKSSSTFNVVKYINNYSDLQNEFGPNYSRALEHYVVFGKNEGRNAV